MRTNIFRLGLFLLGILLVFAAYLSYIAVYRGPAIAFHPYNRRWQVLEEKISRGKIYDATGTVLAYDQKISQGKRRVYSLGEATAHVLGYCSARYGRAGLEAFLDRHLLGMEGSDSFRNLVRSLLGEQKAGGDVFLTIDAQLQQKSMELLGGRRGAVVVLDPRTGAVRAMVSSPSFDSNRLDQIWEEINADEFSPLLNRATCGAYPPGSSFKVVTAAAALTADQDLARRVIDCPGYIDVEGFRLGDVAAHGRVDLIRALAVSCNTYFASLGLEAGAVAFYRTVKNFGFEEDPGLGLPVRPATFAPPGKLKGAELAASAIGQGEVLVSPLHMAMAAAAVANEGVLMRPYLIEELLDSSGRTVQRAEPRAWKTALPAAAAAVIREGMVEAVARGTAGAAGLSGVQVAGKTGSAQNPLGKTHAWFIGFAPASKPRLAVAVILENAGSGGEAAAPLAGKLFSLAFARGY